VRVRKPGSFLSKRKTNIKFYKC